MKSYFTTFILTALFLASTFSASFTQTNWTKFQNNPVLDPGPSGAWDDGFVVYPSVLFDGNIYHMWYSGGILNTPGSIGYATSPDGIAWTKYDDPTTTSPPFAESDPVLNRGEPGEWDDEGINAPFVLLLDTTYHMWYTGDSDPANNNGTLLGHATSTDGVSWIEDTLNPVLNVGPAGSWDDVWIWTACVLFDGSIYHMWYGAWGGIGDQVRIGHATSPHPDSSWTKDTLNPVLSYEVGRWDYPRVDAPNVIYDGNTYHMWYSGGDIYTWRIGYATSPHPDSSWTKDPGNPVLNWGSAGSWDDAGIGFCSVIFDSGASKYLMWYTGGNGDGHGHIGYATAPVVINVPGDVPTIQAGIDFASDGNIVLVEEGTYYENINFKGKAITVASRFLVDGDTSHINNTIIDGSQPTNPDSGSVVYLESGEDTTSVLKGFTITNGTGTISQYTVGGNTYDARIGGGIFCLNSGGRFVRNKIINNTLSDSSRVSGGGLAAGDYGSDAWVILEENQIINNTISGVIVAVGGGVILTCNGKLVDNIISYNSCTATENEANGGGVKIITESVYPRTVIIEGNQITHNFVQGNGTVPTYYWSARGGGIMNDRSKVLVLENEISHNKLTDVGTGDGSGGGIYMYLAASGSVISGNKISYNINEVTNTKYGGGISLASCDVPVHNNIISGNSAMHGGGIYLTYNNPVIINNTIVNNSASTSGGGFFSEVSTPYVINNILWDNQAGNGQQITGNFIVRYSNIQGGYAGEGNISKEPMLHENFELSDSSSCIGAGTLSYQYGSTTINCPPIGFFGRARPSPSGTNPDMGACESFLGSPVVGLENQLSDNIPKSYDLKQNYPNPFNPTTTIEFTLPHSGFVTLKIFNILGEEVVTLVSDRLSAGSYSYDWDASNLASGIYLYRLQAGDYVETRKMVLMR